MQKNVSGQKWVVFAFDITDNTAKTGDASQITANIQIDGGVSTGTNTTNPTELEDGYYEFPLTQAETNGEILRLFPASSTGSIQVIGVPGVIYTMPTNFIDLSVEASTGRVDIASVAGTAQTANDNGADLNTLITQIGTAGDGLTNINLPDQTMNITGNITGNLTGSVGSVTGHTPQTGDNFIRLGFAGVGLTHLSNHLTDIKGTGFVKDTHSLVDIESYVDLIDDVTNGLNKIAADARLILSGVAGISGSAMRGTDNAFLASSAPTNFSSLGIESDGDLTKVNLCDTNTDMRGTDSAALASDYTSARAGYLDNINGHTAQTGDSYALIGNAGVGLTYIRNDLTSVLADTNELQTDWANGGRLDTLIDNIITLLDDPRGEPSQGALPVNPDAMTKLDYMYKLARNKIETGTTSIKIFDDAGTTVDHLSTISAAGNTFTRGEFGTGA